MSNVTSYRIAMHQGDRLVTLDDILRVVNGSGLVWNLMNIEAISMPNSCLDVLQLEREVQDASQGKIFTDSDLRALARQLDQVIECRILGFAEGQSFDLGNVPEVEIVAFDSTEWVLRTGGSQGDRLDAGSPLLREL